MKKLLIFVLLLFNTSLSIAEDNIENTDIFEKQINNCRQDFLTQEQECPKSGSMKCHNYLIRLNQQTQKCYMEVANNIYQQYYSSNAHKAENDLKNYVKLTYELYLQTYSQTNFCIQNNCGISIYLYSEYATTQTLEFYINKLLNSIKANQ